MLLSLAIHSSCFVLHWDRTAVLFHRLLDGERRDEQDGGIPGHSGCTTSSHPTHLMPQEPWLRFLYGGLSTLCPPASILAEDSTEVEVAKLCKVRGYSPFGKHGEAYPSPAMINALTPGCPHDG